jgi:hypothetical protein
MAGKSASHPAAISLVGEASTTRINNDQLSSPV